MDIDTTKLEEPKAEFYQPEFGVEYKVGDDTFTFRIPADTFEEAEAKLEAIKASGMVYGQIM